MCLCLYSSVCVCVGCTAHTVLLLSDHFHTERETPANRGSGRYKGPERTLDELRGNCTVVALSGGWTDGPGVKHRVREE